MFATSVAPDPIGWLKKFSDYYIRNPRISAVGLSVMVEIFGVSVPHLMKTEMDWLHN